MAKSDGPFMVVYGDEEFLIDRFIDRRKTQWVKRDIVCIDCDGLSAPSLVERLESQRLFEDHGRAYVLDNVQDLKKATDDSLVSYIAGKAPQDLSCLVLAVVRSNKVPAVWLEASKKGSLTHYVKPKPWEKGKVSDQLASEAKSLGLKLDTGVLDLFLRFVGTDLRTGVNELRKLTHLVGADHTVKKAHLPLLAVTAKAEPFEVAELAFEKNVSGAMRAMSLVYRELGDSSCVQVVSALMRQAERSLVVRRMLDRGDSSSVIAAQLDANEYLCKIKYIPLARKHSVESLIGHMQNLCRLDTQVKGSARSKRTLVELAVLSVAA